MVWTWSGAIAINGCGVALNLIAAFGWFARTMKDGKIYKNTVK